MLKLDANTAHPARCNCIQWQWPLTFRNNIAIRGLSQK